MRILTCCPCADDNFYQPRVLGSVLSPMKRVDSQDECFNIELTVLTWTAHKKSDHQLLMVHHQSVCFGENEFLPILKEN